MHIPWVYVFCVFQKYIWCIPAITRIRKDKLLLFETSKLKVRKEIYPNHGFGLARLATILLDPVAKDAQDERRREALDAPEDETGQLGEEGGDVGVGRGSEAG